MDYNEIRVGLKAMGMDYWEGEATVKLYMDSIDVKKMGKNSMLFCMSVISL